MGTYSARKSELAASGVSVELDSKSYVLLVDPVGNVMMYYTQEHTAEEIMTDLETLLRYSSLG
jgi:cytochrome oxidase Cu insertion factor (SCO1/SenC/PrrC family)